METRHRQRTQLIALLLPVLAACARSTDTTAQPAPNPPAAIHFWRAPGLKLGRPPREALVNQNGSPRVESKAHYERFFRELAPRLEEWSADPRINLNPNFVAALIAKESGFDPHATSGVPANGLTQITHIADADLRLITRDAADYHWMQAEVANWARHPVVHSANAREATTDSMLAAGTLSARNEYLFDPALSMRAGMFWLRILAQIWQSDQYPGMYGRLASEKLAGNQSLSDAQLLQLVTVSYNQGHPYVKDLVEKHGTKWTLYLNAEALDYLERIEKYTVMFQQADKAR